MLKWTAYDGTPETLPTVTKKFQTFLVMRYYCNSAGTQSGADRFIVTSHEVLGYITNHGDKFSFEEFDLWLPIPTEEQLTALAEVAETASHFDKQCTAMLLAEELSYIYNNSKYFAILGLHQALTYNALLEMRGALTKLKGVGL